MILIIIISALTFFSPSAKLPVISGVILADTLTSTYTNPVGTSDGPIRMGDPFVILHDGRYYLYATSAGDGFKCWTSTDLANWRSLGYALKTTGESWGGGAFWAPEVTYYRGKFYMVYSCYKKGTPRDKITFRLCLAVSDKPEGPFKDLYAPWFDIGWSCIDGHIFIDNDSTTYLYLSRNFGREDTPGGYLMGLNYAVRLKPDFSGIIGEPVLVGAPEQEWEFPNSMDTRCNEGVFVLKKDDIYYMTYSANNYVHPHYGIGFATALHPLGPWTKSSSNPIVSKDLDIGVAGPGHNSIVTSPDGKELFMVYHTHDDAKNMRGRVLNIDRLIFDEKGNLKLIGPTRSPQPLPSGIH